MAETFYGYQERDPESQINWAEVGKNFSDMLAEEARVREEKKSAIDEATREAQRKINETPQGQNGTLSDFALDYAADAQEVMLIQERLLKSGRLKPRDYTVMRQNLVDGTDQAFSVLQTYQDEFARKMEMRNNGETQYLDQWNMENAESFGNFNRSKLVINPETGQVSVAFMDENGKIPTDPTKFRAVSSLRNSIGMDFMKYDLDKNTADFVKSQGNWQQITRSIGSSAAKGVIQIMSDPMKKSITVEELKALGIEETSIQQGIINYYNEAESIFINSQLNDDYNTSSILTDFGQAGYTFTYDPKQQGDKTILLTTDSQGRPVPQYTDEQRKDAESILRSAIRSKISKEVTTTVVSDYTPTPQYEYQRGDEEEEQVRIAQLWADVYSGDQAGRRAAIAGILGTTYASETLGLDDIKFKDGEIQLIFNEPSMNRTISPTKNPNFDDWMKGGIEIFGNNPEAINSVEKKGDYRSQADYVTGVGARTTQQPVNPVQQASNVLSLQISPDMFFKKNSTDTTKKLKAILSSLGFEYDSSSIVGRNYITIKNPTTGSDIKFNSNYENMDDSADEASNVIDWVVGQLSDQAAESFLITRSGGMEDY